MAQQVPDLYAILGVAHDATDEDIKRAYRRLAREYHPDVNADPEAERRFKEIVAAYETLSDPSKRRQYDLYGQQGGQGIPDFMPFQDLGDLFDVFFGGGMRRPHKRSRTHHGEDLFVDATISFEEAAFGVQTVVEADTWTGCVQCQGSGCEPGTTTARCGRCGGSGQIQDVARSLFGTVMTARPCPACEATGEVITSPCTECRGQGRVVQRRKLRIEIPAGVDEGTDLRIAGGGHDGRAGGAPGDLYVAVHVRPHPVFERRGHDLVCALTVPMTQAALGAEVTVPTLDGDETLRIEAGTASGTVLRVRGKGVPNLGRRGRGDLFVTVLVETPKPRSKEERDLLERLAALRDEVSPRGSGLAARLSRLMGQ